MKPRIAVLLFGILTALLALPAFANAPQTTVAYQVMISTGLAAHDPFEVWFIFDKSSDPSVPGYSLPAGPPEAPGLKAIHLRTDQPEATGV